MEDENIYMEECSEFAEGDLTPTDRAGSLCGLGCVATGSRCGTGCGITGSGKHCGWICNDK